MPLEDSWCSAVLSGAPLVKRKQESWLEASADNDGTGMALAFIWTEPNLASWDSGWVWRPDPVRGHRRVENDIP